ncbi:MAG: hypothetical protein R2755_05785 [Acidimicrobiales bacterium]
MSAVAFVVVFMVVAGFGLQALWAHLRIANLSGALALTADRVADLERSSETRAQLGDEHRCQHLSMVDGTVVECEGTAVVLVETANGAFHAYCTQHRPPAIPGDWSNAA